MQHSLSQHPLFRLEALGELADTLPAAAVEYVGDRWTGLWNIEQSPAYRHVIDALLEEVKPLIPVRECGMGRRETSIILSSPGSVTSAHFNPEHTLHLQLLGTRKVIVGRFPDRRRELKELDRYHDGQRGIIELPPASSISETRPGEGIYLYPWAPHRVYNGSSTSLSLSITFRTGYSERLEQAHRFNARLRRLGLSPRPAGESPIGDWMKAAFIGTRGVLSGIRRNVVKM